MEDANGGPSGPFWFLLFGLKKGTAIHYMDGRNRARYGSLFFLPSGWLRTALRLVVCSQLFGLAAAALL